MHYFFLPLVPLTLAGALFFKRRFAAYGFPVILTLIKLAFTKPALIYLFTALALGIFVSLVRGTRKQSGIPIFSVLFYAALGVFIYELVGNFGFWLLGSCVPAEERYYPLSLAGLAACYQGAMKYTGLHFMKAVPSSLLLIPALAWIGRWDIAVSLRRLISGAFSK